MWQYPEVREEVKLRCQIPTAWTQFFSYRGTNKARSHMVDMEHRRGAETVLAYQIESRPSQFKLPHGPSADSCMTP